MGYRLNRLDKPVFIAVPKPMLTESSIHHRLESCEAFNVFYIQQWKKVFLSKIRFGDWLKSFSIISGHSFKPDSVFLLFQHFSSHKRWFPQRRLEDRKNCDTLSIPLKCKADPLFNFWFRQNFLHPTKKRRAENEFLQLTHIFEWFCVLLLVKKIEYIFLS